MGRVESSLEFRFNFGSGLVWSLTQWVALGRVKIGPTHHFAVTYHLNCVNILPSKIKTIKCMYYYKS